MRRITKTALTVAVSVGCLAATAGTADAYSPIGTTRGTVGNAGCVNILSTVYDLHDYAYQTAGNFGTGTCTVFLRMTYNDPILGRVSQAVDVHTLGPGQAWQTVVGQGYYDGPRWTAQACINSASYCTAAY